MRTVHVIGIAGEEGRDLLDQMIRVLPGIPIFTSSPSRVCDFITSSMDMVDDLMESGLSDMASVFESTPLVMYVTGMTREMEEAVKTHPAEVSLYTIATEPGYEDLESYLGSTTSGVAALYLISEFLDVRV